MTTVDLTDMELAIPAQVEPIEIADAPTGALSPMLQSIARNYLATRARAGAAILESARYLAEARAAAKYGEWKVFLDATGTQEDTASRMLAIAERASADPQYARAISDGRLALTAAFEILNAPAETQQHALESETPTPASTIRKAKQELKLRTSAEFVPAPAEIAAPLPSEDEQHRGTIEVILSRPHTPALIQQAYDHAREIHDLPLYNKMIALIDRATDEPIAAAPARLPAVPPRPKRPISADASAVIAYIKQMEVYANALESVIMELQKKIR